MKWTQKPRGQQTHIARQANQINLRLFERGNHLGIVLFAHSAFGRDESGVEPAPSRRFQTRSVTAVRNHNRYLRVNAPGGNGVSNTFEVGAAPAEQNPNFLERWHIYV